MMTETIPESYVYRAPAYFIGIFYFLLALFILVDITFLISILNKTGLSYRFPIFMFSFILVYMCYFTAAISHKIEVWKDGRIKLTSLRRAVDTTAEDIEYVEGPVLPIGFIRFRLQLEKGYLFSNMGDASLHKVLAAIKTADPKIKFKKIKTM